MSKALTLVKKLANDVLLINRLFSCYRLNPLIVVNNFQNGPGCRRPCRKKSLCHRTFWDNLGKLFF